MEYYIERILEEMKKQGITAKRLEQDTGIGQNTISFWKRGTQPTVEKLIKVIKYLDISADEIFEIQVQNPQDTKLALLELRMMSRVLNHILDSNDIKDVHELALGGIEYTTKEHKRILEEM